MTSGWVSVIVLWGGIIGVIIACLLPEFKKTPEQRKAEAKMVRDTLQKNREDAKAKRQEAKNNAPAKSCWQSAIELVLAVAFVMLVLLVCILALMISGN